jgi:hypothetical protein
MAVIYTNILHYKALQNVRKLGFLVCKYNIWHPFWFQLAYCDTIIQRNSRINLPVIGNLSSSGAPLSSETAKPMLLDSFFPFDPYRLTKSKVFVQVSLGCRSAMEIFFFYGPPQSRVFYKRVCAEVASSNLCAA